MTQAHWFQARWRYRDEDDQTGWTYAELRSDVPATAVVVEKRHGTARRGYRYEWVPVAQPS